MIGPACSIVRSLSCCNMKQSRYWLRLLLFYLFLFFFIIQDGREEMAVKIIDQSFLNQEYKAKENLEREISIMKLMKGCDNVVQIFIAAVS